jgi:hypothetical protein
MILIGIVFAAALVVAGAMIGILTVLAVGIRRQDNSGTLSESQGRAARGSRAINGLHTARMAQPPDYRNDLPVSAGPAGYWR